MLCPIGRQGGAVLPSLAEIVPLEKKVGQGKKGENQKEISPKNDRSPLLIGNFVKGEDQAAQARDVDQSAQRQGTGEAAEKAPGPKGELAV